MDDRNFGPSYDDLAREFMIALNRVLLGETLSPMTVLTNVPLTLALLDVCHAVRHQRPAQYLVSRACAAFADFAAQHDHDQRSVSARSLRAVQ